MCSIDFSTVLFIIPHFSYFSNLTVGSLKWGRGFLRKAPSPFQKAPSPFQKAPSPFQKAPSPFQKALSPFQKALSLFQKAPSPFQKRARAIASAVALLFKGFPSLIIQCILREWRVISIILKCELSDKLVFLFRLSVALKAFQYFCHFFFRQIYRTTDCLCTVL